MNKERDDFMRDQVQSYDPNAWRLQTPGVANWCGTARPDDPNK